MYKVSLQCIQPSGHHLSKSAPGYYGSTLLFEEVEKII